MDLYLHVTMILQQPLNIYLVNCSCSYYPSLLFVTGSHAEKICIVGDSAGANMALSVAMRLASCGLRQPDAVISIYGGLLVKYTPSPSRILSLMDPLLPLGVVALCLRGNF